MQTVNIHEAKTHLSRLLEAVERGEEVIIARARSADCHPHRLQTAAPQNCPAGQPGRADLDIGRLRRAIG